MSCTTTWWDWNFPTSEFWECQLYMAIFQEDDWWHHCHPYNFSVSICLSLHLLWNAMAFKHFFIFFFYKYVPVDKLWLCHVLWLCALLQVMAMHDLALIRIYFGPRGSVTFFWTRLLMMFWLQDVQGLSKFLKCASGTLVEDARKHCSWSVMLMACAVDVPITCSSSPSFSLP